jgi:hypothetical protein
MSRPLRGLWVERRMRTSGRVGVRVRVRAGHRGIAMMGEKEGLCAGGRGGDDKRYSTNRESLRHRSITSIESKQDPYHHGKQPAISR